MNRSLSIAIRVIRGLADRIASSTAPEVAGEIAGMAEIGEPDTMIGHRVVDEGAPLGVRLTLSGGLHFVITRQPDSDAVNSIEIALPETVPATEVESAFGPARTVPMLHHSSERVIFDASGLPPSAVLMANLDDGRVRGFLLRPA